MLVIPTKVGGAIIITFAFATTRMAICNKITIDVTTTAETTFSMARYQSTCANIASNI